MERHCGLPKRELRSAVVIPAEAKKIAKCWRKSRIAARILLREERGQLTPRDIRVGRVLGHDRGVTPRLIKQALHGFELRDTRLGRARRPAA